MNSSRVPLHFFPLSPNFFPDGATATTQWHRKAGVTGCDISRHKRTRRVGADRLLRAPNPGVTVTGKARVGWSRAGSEGVGTAWASRSRSGASHAPDPAPGSPWKRAAAQTGGKCQSLGVLGAGRALPCSLLASLRTGIIGGRVSLGSAACSHDFCREAGRAWMFLGAGGGVVLPTSAGFGGEEETPKPSPSSGKDTVEQIHIHLQLASHPCIPRSSHPRGSALPGMLPCAP